MKKILFALIIIFGIFLRFWQLNTLPGGLFLDELNMAVDAKTLVQNGTDQYGRHLPFYFEDATDWKLPGYIYATTFFYEIFGNQILTLHMTSALAGIASIFLIGYIAFLLFPEKKYIGYFAGATLALSPFAIHFSRISYETNLALTCLILYFIALFLVLHNKHTTWWFVVGTLATLVGNWTYPSARFIIPVFTLFFLCICYFANFSQIKRKNILLAASFLVVVAITFIPTILFPFADARQLNLLSVDSKNGGLLTSLFLKTNSVFVSYLREWNLEFLFDKGDLFAYRHGTKEQGIFLFIFIIPYFLGIFWAIQNVIKKNFSLVFLFCLALICGLPSALSSETPYGTRMLTMLIPYTIFIAVGLTRFFAWLGRQKKFLKTILIILLSIIFVYQVCLFMYAYFVDFRQTSLPEFPTAPVQLAAYILHFHKQNPTKQIYFLTDRSCRTWSNDALSLWFYDNLPNKPMIAWNNAYRQVRYAYKKGSPLEAYDRVTIPAAYIAADNLHLYAGKNNAQAPKGSLMVHCGYELGTYDKTSEQLDKVFYMYSVINEDPFYFTTRKK